MRDNDLGNLVDETIPDPNLYPHVSDIKLVDSY